jgi:hypothetical protein
MFLCRFANYVVSSSKPNRIVKLDGQEPFQGAANAAEAALQVSHCYAAAFGRLEASFQQHVVGASTSCWHALQDSSGQASAHAARFLVAQLSQFLAVLGAASGGTVQALVMLKVLHACMLM